MESLTFMLLCLPLALSDVNPTFLNKETLITTLPPQPYAFGYAAGRYPGHIDRTHSEVSDGSGIVHGSFSYVDPAHRIRTVSYTADALGFHPTLDSTAPDLPSDTPAVAAAKAGHLRRFAAIAESHRAPPTTAEGVADTAAVQLAKQRHFELYRRIAEEHARAAAAAEVERRGGFLGE